jgi:resuscitation-promoting factor RpfB
MQNAPKHNGVIRKRTHSLITAPALIVLLFGFLSPIAISATFSIANAESNTQPPTVPPLHAAAANTQTSASTSTTVQQVWTAQVVATADAANISAPTVGSTPVEPKPTTSTSTTIQTQKPTQTTMRSRKTKTAKGNKTPPSTTTLARLLPSTSIGQSLPNTTIQNGSSDAPNSTLKPIITQSQSINTSNNSPSNASVNPSANPSANSEGKGDNLDASFAKLRQCESGNRYDLNTGNGYYGAYQFALGTWQRLGFTGFPHQASPDVQDAAARKLQAKAGWGQWPACSRKLGLP